MTFLCFSIDFIRWDWPLRDISVCVGFFRWTLTGLVKMKVILPVLFWRMFEITCLFHVLTSYFLLPLCPLCHFLPLFSSALTPRSSPAVYCRFLITMQWRWWSAGSRTLWDCLTLQVKINLLLDSCHSSDNLVHNVCCFAVDQSVLRVSPCRSGGLRQTATPQLPSDRRLPRLFLCRIALLFWERQREGEIIVLLPARV